MNGTVAITFQGLGVEIREYTRQVRELPLRITLRKAVALARRVCRARAQLVTDILGGSYVSNAIYLNSNARIAVLAADIPADLTATLQHLGRAYLNHNFDLLGSGWLSPVYGCAAAGFLGYRYKSQAPPAPAQDGSGLERVVSRANIQRSRQIWHLIGRPEYAPIDWQLDFKSGYRWTARRPSLRLSIPVNTGADIKVPWELARLQHLPQLALCAILAKAGASGFESSERYVLEIADQLADFIATNPPRFGVNWIGTMDVAIRAANIALTVALLAGADLPLPRALGSVVANSLHDHAVHVAENLEYSETGRSNHYLADLGGLLWTGWVLSGTNADRFLAFAVAEILKEGDNQFLPDGGNYEGSTNYHRLSGEILVFALALTASFEAQTLKRIDNAEPPPRAWRVLFPELPLARHRAVSSGLGLIPLGLLEKVNRAGLMARAIQGMDNTIVQIGDTDSGRFFNLHPTPLSFIDDNFIENSLDHSGFAAAVETLSGIAQCASMDAVLVKRLISAAGVMEVPVVTAVNDFGDLNEMMSRWHATPHKARRVRRIPIDANDGKWTRAAFPDFGLYVFRLEEMLVAFRCAGRPPADAPRGHRHDDNLSLEYRFKSAETRDPGSFVYTPSIMIRNAYRAASAHNGPRIQGVPLAKTTTNMFDLREAAHAQCIYWREDGVAGEVITASGSILRIVRLSVDELAIFDCVTEGEIADLSAVLSTARGYGRL